MNILDVIKDCISNPIFSKDHHIDELTVNGSDICSVATDSVFSGISEFVGASQPSSIDQKLLKIYMRVWIGFVRMLTRTVTQGNCFVSLSLGYFYPMKGRFVYSPTLEVMEKYGNLLKEDFWNIGPKNRTVKLYEMNRLLYPKYLLLLQWLLSTRLLIKKLSKSY